jgi:polysaccharide biosynthesis protein PslH
MNILYLCHRFPFPPRRGGKIRPFNMIRHLTQAGHQVTVCSLARSREEAQDGQGLGAYCDTYAMGQVNPTVQCLRMLARLPTTSPSSMGFFYSGALQQQVQALLGSRKWDLIVVHCSTAAQYVAHVHDVPKLLDFGDMDSQKWIGYAQFKPFPLSLGYRLEGHKLLACEKRLAQRFDLCTTTTLGEWQTLQGYGLPVDTDWFPNGVDCDYFCPTDGTYEPDAISFMGRMDYYPNQECMLRFCQQVWPLLLAQRATLKLQIVGACPSGAIRRLGALAGVSVTGAVPDVRPYLRGSALMVAPLQIARGTQNKILEAMAMGVPVVTSSLAAGGVDACANQHLVVADSPQAQVRAILDLVCHPRERQRLALAGRARMQSSHAWAHSMQRLDAIIARCLRNFHTHRLERAA